MNSVPANTERSFVLYWMTAFRRTRYNFALQRAVEWANRLEKPLVIFDAIRCHYKWACDRFHQYLIESMRDTATVVSASKATYWAYVEPVSGAAHGLMERIASDSCVVVTDDFPCFFHPVMFRTIVSQWKTRVEAIDSNTIIPMRSTDRVFTVAHSYRRYMQKEITRQMPGFPAPTPLELIAKKPTSEQRRDLDRISALLHKSGVRRNESAIDFLRDLRVADLKIDHSVQPTSERGGEKQGAAVLWNFVSKKLKRYNEDRNEPERSGSSQLSSYLHFGNISAHEFFLAIQLATEWDIDKLSSPNGKVSGFWNMGTDAEALMDQLMTWREIGFNMCALNPNYMKYESLPDWAQTTLAEHESDKRPWVYDLEQFDAAKTHDALWNAAQNQLKQEGRIHNYLRMLWGKKILHWSRTPREALRTMIHLNNKYALDGRNPNSYSGIFWTLGRYDRAWGPERPIFGKVRYMTSESTQSKFSVKNYLRAYAASPPD